MIPAALALALAAVPATLDVPGLGAVPVSAPPGAPQRAILLVSDAGGRDAALDDLARALAARGALVATVDLRAYLRSVREARCAYPAADLEALAQRLQKRAGLGAYLRPKPVGVGLGASLAWAALAEAPAGTFSGAALVGFCPSRPLPLHLCHGSGPLPEATRGGEVVPPAPHLEQPPAILEEAARPGCPAAEVQGFARQIPGATLETVPADATSEARAEAVTARARAHELTAAAAAPPPPTPPPANAPPVSDLPVVENPVAGSGRRMAVILTGDGGWVGLDKGLAKALVAAGVPVAGLDSLKYFWSAKTPEQTAADVARIVAHYRAKWGRDEVLLIGYSRGADIVPFLPPRMPPGERAAVKLVAMLGPESFAEFEVHVVDLFTSVRRGAATSTQKAVEALDGTVRILCVQGVEEKDSACPLIDGRPEVHRVVLPGAHHFDRDYPKLARLVLEAAP
ncbi:virulence factor family protein [Anaeromyxobacter sp. K]|uniref:virulence factor family protein n=1 Tax=Anaeromyxobacter sp. (strain K) TaxID=447217 RepID=UPI00015F89F9|nr:AcvB/VirJ family lysyl-phosphatidylglycerol hydrolase [Anaeromyxobacter sp. K]ACG72848.1 virulence factor family protein [Anaeromyxobacter sp. K]